MRQQEGILYFEVSFPEDIFDPDTYMQRVADTIAATDFEDDILILEEGVTPKFLPFEKPKEVSEVPVVPYTVSEDEIKELATS